MLINDHFQNFKRYNIPKAQLVIADIPYNVGINAYGSNPSWYKGGDNKNGPPTATAEKNYTAQSIGQNEKGGVFLGGISKDGAVTNIRFVYDTAGAATGRMHWHLEWRPVSDDGNAVPA